MDGGSTGTGVSNKDWKAVPVVEFNGKPWVPLKQALAMFNVIEQKPGVFKFKHGTLSFKKDDQVFDMAGQKIWMGYPAHLIGNKLYVHQRDWETSISPVLKIPDLYHKAGNRIVIDPGHGGRDAGAIATSPKIYEKDINLDISLRIKKLLEDKGWEVLLTRENDATLDLEPRISMARSFEPDFFISVHANSALANSAKGLETFYHTPVGLPSNLKLNYSDKLQIQYPANQYDNKSYKLAWSVQRHVLIETGASDRGVKKARFMGVLRNQNCPAILIETGFLSNPQENQLLAHETYRQKLAVGIAKAFPDLKATSQRSNLKNKKVRLARGQSR